MWLPGLAATDSSFQTSATTVTAHATPHTKGSWVQLVASTPFDVTLIGVAGSDTHQSGAASGQLTDIGIGATEVVLIDNIPTGTATLQYIESGKVAWFPVEIPAGTKISARMQSVTTVDVVDIQLFMYGGSSWSSTPQFQSVDTLGAVTASSQGTSLSASIVEIIASTAEDYKALGWGVDGGVDTLLGSDPFLEIFVGAGAAEKSLITGIQQFTSSVEALGGSSIPQGIIPMEMNIPSGSRLSAQLSTGGALLGLVIYGFR